MEIIHILKKNGIEIGVPFKDGKAMLDYINKREGLKLHCLCQFKKHGYRFVKKKVK